MKDIMTNEELVKLYRAGDPSALEAIYLQNYGLIRMTVRKLCRYEQDAFDDEMQEAFFALAEAVKSFPDDPKAKLATYLVNSIKWKKWRRYQTDQKHNHKNNVSLDEPLPGFEESNITLGDAIADPDAEFEEDCVNRIADQAIQDRLKTVIADIIAGLPKRPQEVILARMEGKSRSDIAKDKGVSVSNIEDAEYRAHKAFRKKENRERLAEFLEYYDLGYKNTGFGFWRDTGYSSVELAIERKMEAEGAFERGSEER